MNLRKKLITSVVVLLVISGVMENLTVKASDTKNTIFKTAADSKTEVETDIPTDPPPEADTPTDPPPETDTPTNPPPETDTPTDPPPETDTPTELKNTAELDHYEKLQTDMTAAAAEIKTDNPDKPLLFEAYLEHRADGWRVTGIFKDFPSDTILVQPMCATDGKTYQDCGHEWNLLHLGSEEEEYLAMLQNQLCLYASDEPFKSYLTKDLNHFYVKLRIVREDGTVCETQTAVIDRGKPQPVTTEFKTQAIFPNNMLVREGRPPAIQYYGQYQITVHEDASSEEISAVLPDTLPVRIQLMKGSADMGDDIVDCPVSWKPLNLPQLTAGEHVTVMDAAEDLVIPSDTILNTQTGIYQINHAIAVEQYGITDEVRLILNVIAKDEPPAGVLAEENHGLEMAFLLKPTGASSIRAYTITEGGTEWKELSGLSLMETVNAQPLTENSGYAVILEKNQEPYRSYRKAQEAGEKPTPFFVRFKIEGGVYNGRQLTLAWPNTYDLPLNLPEIGGSGGNQGNAGSDNKNDSTGDGQRPGLPEKTENASMSGLPPVNTAAYTPLSNPDEELMSGLSEQPENEPAADSRTDAESNLTENKTVESRGTEPHGQQENIAAIQDETILQRENEPERELASDNIPDITSGTPFEYREESTQSGIQLNPNEVPHNTENRIIFLIMAGGMVTILISAGITVFRCTTGMKIMDVIHRIMIRK